MKKDYQVNQIVVGIVFLSLFLVLLSCQKDEEIPRGRESSLDYTMKIITEEQIKDNEGLYGMLQQFDVNSYGNNLGRGIHSHEYGFTIHTEYAKLIETEEGYRSYTFYISNDSLDGPMENLLFSLNEEGGYDAYVVRYDFTEEEFPLLEDINNRRIEFLGVDVNYGEVASRGTSAQMRVKSFICEETYVSIYTLCSTCGKEECPLSGWVTTLTNTDCYFIWGYDYGDYNGTGSGSSTSGGGDGTGDGDDGEPPNDDSGHNSSVIITTPMEEPGEEEDPCEGIATLLDDSGFVDKMEELEDNEDLHHETGYSHNMDGNFTQLQQNGNNAVVIPKPFDPNLIGAMHVHYNDYQIPDQDGDGTPDIRKMIRQFSASDIKTFLEMVKNAHQNGNPTSKVYLMMVSSQGNYMLRFTGNVSNINLNFNPKQLKSVYEGYFKKYSDEKAFLMFMKNEIPSSTGIRLYKIKSNGTVKEKFLDENDRKKSETCP